MLILVAETDPSLRAVLCLMLKASGHRVETTGSGDEALDFARQYDFDCLVLDLALPDLSGFAVLRELRNAKVATPALALTAAIDVEDKVRAFALGADDLLVKPFHKDELVARLQALARRAHGAARARIAIGGLIVDVDQQTAAVGGVAVPLTGKEYLMIELLAMRQGKCITKETMFHHLYAGADEPEIKIINVFICKLRKKLAVASGGLAFIETIWGRGYTMKPPEEVRGGKYKPAGVTLAMMASERARANAAA